jgi:hypothetical protein
MNTLGSCIFCSAVGPFERDEHPIPESLGNDDLVLPRGLVCDICNQYFGVKIENPVLSSPPFSVERTAAAIRTKKGRFSSHKDSQVRLFSTGCWGRVILATDSESSLPIISSPDGSGILIVAPPVKYDELLGRFLLKMGIELLSTTVTEVRSPRFDNARQYARFGRSKQKWEIAYGLYPDRRDLLISTREDDLGPLETRQIYRFGMGEMADGRIIFSFMFITHVFAICLSDERLGSYTEEFNRMNGFSLVSNLKE